MLQTRPYGLVPPNLPALCPSGHGACTVRSTRVFVSDFLQASIAGLPLSLTTLHLRQVGTGLCSGLVSSYLKQHQQAAGPCPAHNNRVDRNVIPLCFITWVTPTLNREMKMVTIGTYRKDKLYPKVVRATASLLKDSDEISPVAILMKIGNLTTQDYDAWRRGRVPYLERVFQGSLSKANRCLRIIGFHAHDLSMVPCPQTYQQLGKKHILRFSRSGDPNVEKSYARHFRWNQSQRKKQTLIERTLSGPVAEGDS